MNLVFILALIALIVVFGFLGYLHMEKEDRERREKYKASVKELEVVDTPIGPVVARVDTIPKKVVVVTKKESPVTQNVKIQRLTNPALRGETRTAYPIHRDIVTSYNKRTSDNSISDSTLDFAESAADTYSDYKSSSSSCSSSRSSSNYDSDSYRSSSCSSKSDSDWDSSFSSSSSSDSWSSD